MSATVPLFYLSSHSATAGSPLRAVRRLRLITSHLTPSSLGTTVTSNSHVPRSSLGSRQFTTTLHRKTDQFSFTTACSFRGKPGSPIYSPTKSDSSASTSSDEQGSSSKEGGEGDKRGRGSRGFAKLRQGLDADHPLSKWRDAQLEKSPNGAGHDWFFVQGIPNDHSVSATEETVVEGEKVKIGGIKGVVLGVADGVGGWEESGVDPSHFAQALMWFARERVRKGEVEPSRGGKGLKTLLEGAFEDVTKEKAILAGSSTACLVALDSSTGKLHAANLGDSSYMILRPTPTPSQQQQLATPPPSPEESTNQRGGEGAPKAPSYSIVHSEPSQTHFFNAPYQLSKLPPSSRGSHSTENSLMDTPSDAAVTPKEGIQLREGDVVVLSTDGFGDNVFGEEMQQLCQLVHEKCLETQQPLEQQQQRSTEVDEHLLASSLAQTSLNFARLVMFKKDKVTPFEVEARRYGYGKGSGLGGGKVDDVTVVIAVVGKTTS